MNKKIAFSTLCLILVFGTALFSLNPKHASATQANGEKTLILYDAISGAIPDAKMMSFFDFPPGDIVQTYENGSTILDTTKSGNSTYAGWISNATNTLGFPSLNRAAGFQLDFTLQVESESHTSRQSRQQPNIPHCAVTASTAQPFQRVQNSFQKSSSYPVCYGNGA